MPNTLGNYNETFFAQEALIQLENALGLAGRIHRGYEPTSQTRGDTIQIRAPGEFTVQNAPSSAQDVATKSLAIVLDQWKEVKFKLTDKELTLSANEIIEEHIRPAAVALADFIDRELAALYYLVPYSTTASNPLTMEDLTAARAQMFDRKVPMQDVSMLHGMVSGVYEAAILNKLAASGMQPNQQDQAIRAGSIGRLFGFEWFANQNTPVHSSTNMADQAGTVNGAHAIGVKSVVLAALSASAAIKKGDVLVITGHVRKYAITADATTNGTGDVTVAIEPGLEAAVTGGTVATLEQGGASKTQNILFHRNWAALAMAPLSTLGAELGGARMAAVADPKTRLALRSRMYYEGGSSSVFVALDVLFGYKVLDERLAHRVRQP